MLLDLPNHASQIALTFLSVLTFALGFRTGTRKAIGRDRRKEFNAIAVRLRAMLIRQRIRPTPYDSVPSRVDVDLLMNYMDARGKRRFALARQRYKQARSDQTRRDSAGRYYFQDVSPIQAAITDLLSELHIR
ncbi:hypothetical protein E4K72_05955 [Oxalobacteraceae bacterium OM1]|nr:hypothetical protein E4K72_05955 [Oxalobacteraceae bacterium OM1]